MEKNEEEMMLLYIQFSGLIETIITDTTQELL